jgi:hypothetical protein
MMFLLRAVFCTALSVYAAPYSFTSLDMPGAASTMAFMIHNANQTVGRFTDNSDNGHGFRLSGGTFTQIDFPGGTNARASGTNDSGTIVRRYTLPGPQKKTFGYKLVGNPSHPANFSTIDAPGSTETRACNINNGGLIVGDHTLGEAHRGFLFDGRTFTTIVDAFPGSRLRSLRSPIPMPELAYISMRPTSATATNEIAAVHSWPLTFLGVLRPKPLHSTMPVW